MCPRCKHKPQDVEDEAPQPTCSNLPSFSTEGNCSAQLPILLCLLVHLKHYTERWTAGSDLLLVHPTPCVHRFACMHILRPCVVLESFLDCPVAQIVRTCHFHLASLVVQTWPQGNSPPEGGKASLPCLIACARQGCRRMRWGPALFTCTSLYRGGGYAHTRIGPGLSATPHDDLCSMRAASCLEDANFCG